MSKGFEKFLPRNRPFSEIEAAYSLQCDLDKGKSVSVSGYSKLWAWTRRRVRKFLKDGGAEIRYPENTKRKQNQSGQIAIQIPDRYDPKSGQIADRYRPTTRKPNPNPNKNPKDISSELSDDDPANRIPFELSKYLYKKIKNNSPGYREPNFKTWSKHVDLMIRIDKREPEEIRGLIDWCQSDVFWQAVILSTQNLRKNYDKLMVQKVRGNHDGNRKGNAKNSGIRSEPGKYSDIGETIDI